jgi:hypothetical protein
MEIILAFLLFVVLPAVILIIGIQKEKKKRIRERDEMFYEGDVKMGENPDGSVISPTKSIDAVSEITKILSDEVEKATKPKRKKPIRKKKSEFPIEPTQIKPKPRKARKPKNDNKKGGDEMLLS